MKYHFNHLIIEKKWKQYWVNKKVFKFNPFSKKTPYYVLDMFPYPSGKGLHVGHPRGYTASDIIARMKRFQNFEVIHPIGWDAFGLPSEQYSIKTGNHPQQFTDKNIQTFRNQLINLGFSFDYDIEINTSDKRYYKWTQWMFQQFYLNNLAVKENISVNFCPKLNTVLANEETYSLNSKVYSTVGDFPVIQEKRNQWVLKITDFAEDLLSGLNKLNWKDNIKILQKNWIGKNKGKIIKLHVEKKEFDFFLPSDTVLKNITCILISPNNDLIDLKFRKLNKSYFDKIKNLQDIQRLLLYKDGIKYYKKALVPGTNLELDIYINTSFLGDFLNGTYIYSGQKIYYEFASYNGIKLLSQSSKIKKLIVNYKDVTYYKLRDWVFSRQRFWGEPFPVYYDDKNNIYLYKKLPLELPKVKHINYNLNNNGDTPLQNISSWYYFKKDGKLFHNDENVMPQWAGSCWYHIAYLWKSAEVYYKTKLDIYDNKCKKIYAKYLPVNLYIGGKEHAVSHLLYSRFWHKFLKKIGVVCSDEPFTTLINQGMVLGSNNVKMSKSLGNVVDPNDIINKYGADALRCYEMFISDLKSDFPWDDSNIISMRKWLDRVYLVFANNMNNAKPSASIINAYNKFIIGINNDLNNYKFNTSISKMMVFINECFEHNEFNKTLLKNFLIILSCFAPFLSEHLWNLKFNKKCSINNETWPQVIKIKADKINKLFINLPVQINGRIRSVVKIKINSTEDEILKIISKMPKFKKYLENNKIKNIIYINNKIINIII